jgi:hypothetical protein
LLHEVGIELCVAHASEVISEFAAASNDLVVAR